MTDAKQLTVVLIDDGALLRELLVRRWARHPRIREVRYAGLAAEGRAVCEQIRPDVAIIDIMLPDMNGVDLGRKLAETVPDTRRLALSVRCDPYLVHRLDRAGFHGYVNKDEGLRVLETAVVAVGDGRTFFSPKFEEVRRTQLESSESLMKFISDQEIEVMVRLARGLSPDEIAKDLSISRRTLDWHLSNLFRKTGQHNIRSLFQFAVTYGFM